MVKFVRAFFEAELCLDCRRVYGLHEGQCGRGESAVAADYRVDGVRHRRIVLSHQNRDAARGVLWGHITEDRAGK